MEECSRVIHWKDLDLTFILFLLLDNETVSFGEMTREMGSAIILVPLIAILQHIAIVKAFGKRKFIF